MTRSSTLLAARTLTRAVRRRLASRKHPTPAARLRLDTLEVREQPGSALSGLVGGLAEPLAVAAAAFGGLAPAGPKVGPTSVVGPGSSLRGSAPPVPVGLLMSNNSVTQPKAAPASGGASPSDRGSTGTETTPAAAGSLDLSISDPTTLIPFRPAEPEGTPGGNGGGGLANGTAASSLAGQPNTENSGPSGGSANSEDPAGMSVPSTPSVNRSPAAASSPTSTTSSPAAATFVTPPADTNTLEAPAPTAPGPVAPATTSSPIFAVGTDAGVTGQVKVYDAQTRALKSTLTPFGNTFTGGVRVAVADLTGDGTADIVAATGPGGGNKVRVYNGATGKALTGTLGSFTALTAAQANGLWVAAGDVTGDGKADIVVGSDGTATPVVKVFSGANGSLVRTVDLSSLGITGAVRVAAGDVNGDGKADVIVGTSPGQVTHVGAFDGGNGKPLYDYLPFGAGDRSGANLAAGDVDGDAYADVIVGQATGGAQVKVFSGKDTASTWNLDAFPGTTGGVRVGAVDADQDGRLDVLAAQGPGGGEARAYAGVGGGQLASLFPFGNTYTGGLFTVGDARPAAGSGGVGALDAPPTVTIAAGPDILEDGTTYFTVTRTGSTTSGLTVGISLGGTATNNLDYATYPFTYVSFSAGASSATIPVNPYQFHDGVVEGPETVTVTLQGPTGPPPPYPQAYTLGSPSTAGLTIFDRDSLGTTAPPARDPGPCPDPTASAPGTPGFVTLPAGPEHGSGLGDARPARGPGVGLDDLYRQAASYTGVGPTGLVSLCDCPLCASFPWTNRTGPVSAAGGGGREFPASPAVQDAGGTAVLYRPTSAQPFTSTGGGGYAAGGGAPETLARNSTTHEFTLTDSAGQRFVFYDADTSLPAAQRGQLKSQLDPAGNTVSTVTYNGSGQRTQVQSQTTTGGTTTTRAIGYTYLTSGANAGKVGGTTEVQQVGSGSPVTVRTADLAYYDGTTSGGNLGDLKSVTVKDPAGNVLETHYFRYYTSNTSPGYTGGLKFSVTGAAYDRLAAWCAANATTVDAATDAQVAPFADKYLEYDSAHRVTRMDVQGAGCSACSGGVGSYTYAYATSPFADGYNAWKYKRTEGLPDGSVRVTYFNYAQEPLLVVHQEGGQSWGTFYKYDSSGRLTLTASPSAVSGYDEAKADLLNNQSGNYQYLRDGQGLISTVSYYGSTTATSTTAGGVAGYEYQTKVQRGETGTGVLQGTTDYLSRSAGGVTVYPVATATVYRNADGTGGQTTSYGYTWATGSAQPESLTVTLPAVTTGQNGSGSATSGTVVYDGYGRPTWRKDAGGFLTYTQYDDATGAVTKVIRDVDTTQTSTFANLPSGWSTPSGGGLHRTTSYEVDTKGRPTKVTDPNGNVTYTVYNDPAHEVRTYPGWDGTANLPTGPTIVRREDQAHGYRESLTMSAAPAVNGGRPTGAESISGIQSLTRQVLNDAGQVVYSDLYTDLTGVTYSQSSVTLGTAGTNYLRTEQAYDKLGRPNRMVTPSGTIHRTVTDGQGRVVSRWVGTDDTPTSGYWSPTNTAGTDLVKVSEYEYDAGGVGDGLVTKETEHPGGVAADRVTAFSYDWRDRQVATKGGVETSESTSLNRPIAYVTLDNLGEAAQSDTYDGDGLSITADANSDGVPDAPTSSALRARSAMDYDELGRVYQSKTFGVDSSAGTVSTNALVSRQWYNSRGLVIKSSSAGGLVNKNEYDGAGRPTKTLTTDGGGDTGYSDAGTVTGDAVLSQTELTYDAAGNATLMVTRDRFHDETGTGPLGSPASGVHARVSYQASYYDKANRVTDTVDEGTNGGSTYSRPSSVPSRSDSVLVTSYGYNAAGQAETTTDPRGLINKQYYDLAGRTTKTIENYVDGTVSDADDKTVEYTYDPSGQMATLRADLTGGGYQETKWVYGVTSPVVSYDLLKEMRYPDPTSGAASSTEKDGYTYNQLGQVLTKTDRNGTVHTYAYDVLGRQVSDTVTTLGTGVDGAVRRIETAYDGQGNPYLLTSYDAATGGGVVNQVQREYNGLGQLTTEWQATGGAVNTSTTPKVQYAYSFAPSGSTNHSRLTSITYPNGRVVTYNYASGLGDTISRLSSITDGSTTLESYQYLGVGMVVKRAHPEPGVDLTYVKLSGESDGAAGDQYAGLDAFGRVLDQRWTTSGGTAKDRRQYGYDRDGNRLYADNLVSASNSEVYTYDGLNQLTSFQRGTLNGTKDGITGTVSRSQSWDFDAAGNFDSQTTDGTAQTRTANRQNEITSISGATTPSYDPNGNLTTDEAGRQFKYDAWNRMVEVRDSGSTLLATYRYDALGRRARQARGSTTTDLYYSAQWQVLEERVGGAATASYVWSPVYVDAMICRDRDTDGNGSLDERLYPIQDGNYNVVGLLDAAGAAAERYGYDSFGGFVTFTPAWGSRAGSNYAWVHQHQGMRYDAAAGDYHDRNREYTPTLGRWLQIDPIGFAGGDPNLYRYEADSPAQNLDSSGLDMNFSGPNGQPSGPNRRYAPWEVGAPLPPPPGIKIGNRQKLTISMSAMWGGGVVYAQPGHVGKQIRASGGSGFAASWGQARHVTITSIRLCKRDVRKAGESVGEDALIWAGNNSKSLYHTAILDPFGNGFGLISTDSQAGKSPEAEDPSAWKSFSCKVCELTDALLKYGAAAGKKGTEASDAEIWDCIRNAKFKENYSLIGYNCHTWAEDTISECGLSCRESQEYYDKLLKGGTHPL